MELLSLVEVVLDGELVTPFEYFESSCVEATSCL